jgi:hypothetical protein
MNKSLEIARRNLFYITLLLPIVIFPISTAIFEISRTFSIGIMLGLLGVYYFLFNKVATIKLPNKYIMFFFLVCLITNLFSIDKNISILGSYPRFVDGDLVNLITFLFIVLILNIWEKVDLIKIAFYSSLPISIIAVLQSFLSNERIGSTLGQPNFLGLFISLTLLYQLLNFQKIKLKLYLKYAILIVQTYVLIKSASLTAFIALGAVVVYLLLSKKIVIGKPKLILIIFLLAALMFSQGSILFPKFKDIYFQLVDRKQTTISDSLLIRLAIWESTIKLITTDSKHFLLGSGSNTFAIEFEKNRNTKLDNYSEYYLFYDKPHNYFLEIIFSNGFFALILFLLITYKSLKSKNDNAIYIVVILFFIAFNWLDIYSRLLLFSLISLNLKNEEFKGNHLKVIGIVYFFLLLVSGIFLFADSKFYERDYQTAVKVTPFNDTYKAQYLVSENENLNDFFFNNHNPLIKIEGLKLYKGQKLQEFKIHLMENYPNNLPIKMLIEDAK